MDFNQLEAFINIAEQGSFSKAAETLYITQPAISKRISALETQLDVQLFERFGQKIKLSEQGKRLLIDAQAIVGKYHEMLSHNDNEKNKIAGKLRIATSHHIGLYRLPKILKHFVKNYPEVQLDMHFTDSEIAYHEVLHGLSDLAVATLPSKVNPRIHITPLWQDELVLMFGKSHPLAKHPKITLQALSQFPAILPDEDTFTRLIIDIIFEKQQVNYQLAFTTNYLETIKVMVEAGLGWSILPKIMLGQNIIHHNLGTTPANRDLGIMIHKSKKITPTIQAFINALK